MSDFLADALMFFRYLAVAGAATAAVLYSMGVQI